MGKAAGRRWAELWDIEDFAEPADRLGLGNLEPDWAPGWIADTEENGAPADRSGLDIVCTDWGPRYVMSSESESDIAKVFAFFWKGDTSASPARLLPDGHFGCISSSASIPGQSLSDSRRLGRRRSIRRWRLSIRTLSIVMVFHSPSHVSSSEAELRLNALTSSEHVVILWNCFTVRTWVLDHFHYTFNIFQDSRTY